MNSFVIFSRELKVQSRSITTYWMRLLPALIITLTIVYSLTHTEQNAQLGRTLFAQLNLMLYWTIALIAPVLTADSISREKREGTLGLLLLTPLTPLAVVAGKLFSRLLQGVNLLLAILPIIMVPLLFGGVTGLSCLRAAVLQLSILLAGLAAGLLASALAKRTGLVILLSLLLMALFGGLVVFGYCQLSGTPPSNLSFRMIRSFQMITNPNAYYFYNYGNTWAGARLSLPQLFTGFAWVCLGLLLVLLLVTHHIKRYLRATPATAAQKTWLRFWFAPTLLANPYRKWKAQAMSRNPMGWWMEHSWSATAQAFFWIVASLILFVGVLGDGTFLIASLTTVAAFLAGLTGALSWFRDRACGILEGIIVTPLSARDVILGRWRAMLKQHCLPWILGFAFIAFRHVIWRYPAPAGPTAMLMLSSLILVGTCATIGIFAGLVSPNRTRVIALAVGLTIGLLLLVQPASSSDMPRAFLPENIEVDRLFRVSIICPILGAVLLGSAMSLYRRLPRDGAFH